MDKKTQAEQPEKQPKEKKPKSRWVRDPATHRLILPKAK